MLTYDPKKIIALRVGKGWNQSELARAAKLSANTIWNLERGNVTMVKHRTLDKVAFALGVPYQAILAANQGPDMDSKLHVAVAHLTDANKAAVLAAVNALLESQKKIAK